MYPFLFGLNITTVSTKKLVKYPVVRSRPLMLKQCRKLKPPMAMILRLVL